MVKTLYVFRKMTAADTVNHLIAVLRKEENGEITIESRLDDRTSSQSYSIPILSTPETESVGEYKKRLRKWLNEFLPPADNKALMEMLMKKLGMTEYDEWEWLKRFNPDGKSIISFSDKFPKNYMRHDLKLPCIDDNDSQNFLINQEYEESDLDADLFDEEDFDLVEDDFDEDEDEEDDTAWNEWLANNDEDEDDRMTCDSFEVHDENIAFPFPLFEENAQPKSSEKPAMTFETFSKLQSDFLVTNKTTIRKTFEALADLPLSVYLGGMKGTEKMMSDLSRIGRIPKEKLKGFTVYDLIKEFSPVIKTNEDVPDSYGSNIGEVYKILSTPIGNAMIKKPIRIA